MVTDSVTNREQLPVTIDGKQYYGCCRMCEAKLKDDPASRLATDPLSGKQADKSRAVIGASPDGKVYYFESVENLTAFSKSPIR
jgi:YHS domain-containing protein